MKYFALTSVAAALVLAFTGCKAVNHQTSASVIQSDTVRYLGGSDSLPASPNGNGAADDNRPNGAAGNDFRGANQPTRPAPEQNEPTGLAYVGNGIYNFFARPFQKKPDDHCKRNWLGFKVSDIVDGVPAPAERMQQIRQLGEAANEVDAQRAESYIAAWRDLLCL